MTDELRATLPRAFERLADDLLIGRHADPHVAFAVLIYPDRHPAIIAVTPRGSGAHDITTLVMRRHEDDEDEDAPERERFFTIADLEEAGRAIDDALIGWRTYSHRHEEREFGAHLLEWIAGQWQRRRDNALQREMEKAAHDAKYAFKCEICGSGYTERGLKMHQARAVYCSRRLAERAIDKAAADG